MIAKHQPGRSRRREARRSFFLTAAAVITGSLAGVVIAYTLMALGVNL